MDTDFWQQRWENCEIQFHQPEANPLLLRCFAELALTPGSRVFVPLCGKTLDIAWLLSHGYRVVGVELSEMAIEQLFAELGVKPAISSAGELCHFRADNIDIFVGDFFALSRHQLGTVNAVYDRAALVALPEEMRKQYSEHLIALTGAIPQLLITYDYDQRLLEGPPFSITEEEVRYHYGQTYDVSLVASVNVTGGLKGKCRAEENVWLLAN